jgi:hypothetical protein
VPAADWNRFWIIFQRLVERMAVAELQRCRENASQQRADAWFLVAQTVLGATYWQHIA